VTLKDEPMIDPGNVVEMEMLLARSAYEGAADQALLILADATRRLDLPELSVRSLLRSMLTLHSVAQAPKASEVSSAFEAWLAASGGESTHLRGENAVLWTLVRELDAMKEGLPNRLRSVTAHAALAGDFSVAQTVFKYFRLAQQPEAEAVAALLRRRAPVIAAALADVLDPPPRPVAPPPRARKPARERLEGSAKWLWYAPLVAGVLMVSPVLGKWLNGFASHSPTVHPTPPSTSPATRFDADALPAVIDPPGPVEVSPLGVAIDGGARDAGPLRGR
jgi:hypothetical protein